MSSFIVVILITCVYKNPLLFFFNSDTPVRTSPSVCLPVYKSFLEMYTRKITLDGTRNVGHVLILFNIKVLFKSKSVSSSDSENVIFTIDAFYEQLMRK